MSISIKGGVHGRYLFSSHPTWATAYGGSSVSCSGVHLSLETLEVSTYLTTSYGIRRPFLAFDTSPLAGMSIISAKLRLWVTAVSSVPTIKIYVTRGVQPDPIGPDVGVDDFDTPWAAQNPYNVDGGSILLSDLVLNQYNDIDLNASGLSWIEQAGGLLSQYESMDYWVSTYADFYISPTTYQFCQTFTPRISHTIKKVKLRLIQRHAGTPPDVYVAIKATDGEGKPTEPVLATGTIPGSSINQTGWGKWIECDLGAGADLTAETLYAIVCSGGAGANHAGWAGTTGCTYTRGHSWYSSDGGSSWVGYPANYDQTFDEYGVDIPGGTLLVLRTSYDINNSPPGLVNASADFYAAQHGDAYAPLLDVDYSPPGFGRTSAEALVKAGLI